jgi:hypothetical protein
MTADRWSQPGQQRMRYLRRSIHRSGILVSHRYKDVRMQPSDVASNLGELVERLAAVLAGESRSHWDQLNLHPVHGRILVYLSNANRYSDTLSAVVVYLATTKGTVRQSI